MKINILLGLMVIAGFPFLSSCNKEEPKPAGVTFEVEGEEVTESDGTIKSFHPLLWQSFSGSSGATGREIKIKLVLSKPAAATSVLAYSVGGTAKKNSASATGDFELTGNNVTIEKGATEAFITLTLFEDFSFEVDNSNNTFETIILTLESVISGPVTIGEQKVYTLTVNEDDTLIVLDWTAAGVDMDLFLWYANDSNPLTYSASGGSDPEAVFIPGGFPNGKYKMSYTYYSGNSDNLSFTSSILNLGGTINSSTAEFLSTGNYKLVNINRYDSAQHPNYKGNPAIVQTMDKSGLNYINATGITAPATGSRYGNFGALESREILNSRKQVLSLEEFKKNLLKK